MKSYFEGSAKRGGLEGVCRVALVEWETFRKFFVSWLIWSGSLDANGGAVDIIFRHEVRMALDNISYPLKKRLSSFPCLHNYITTD